jgi:hypothetical protein
MPRSEVSRERETQKYLISWLESSRGNLSPKNISRDDPLQYDAGLPRHEASQKISRDKALVAFAQLGCLRLMVKRGIVTLISSSTSYILAEATRTISLLSGGQHAEGDELWFGVAKIPKSQGISQHALDAPMYTATSSSGQSYTAPALVISDMAQDPRSSGKKYVGNGTSFYAGVPITTKNGFVIGVFTVTDDKVRGGLSIEELQFMEDIAATVMDHLENIRNDTARHRGERMVLGLGAFTEGQASMHPEQGGDADSTASGIDIASQNSEGGVYQQMFKGLAITEIDPADSRAAMERTRSHDSQEAADDVELTSADGVPQTHQDNAADPGLATASPTTASTSLPKKLILNSIGSPAPLSSANSSSVPLELRQTFARAANILRQATGSDGVMFFDAQSANVGKGTPAFFRSESNDLSTSSDDSMSGSGASSDDIIERHSGYPKHPNHEHEGPQPQGYRKQSKPKKCEMLGHSFRLSSVASLKNQNGFVLREGELKTFLRR